MSLSRNTATILLIIAAVAIPVIAWFARSGDRPVDGAGILAPIGASYVKSGECAQCHAEQHEKWLGSHHDLAMQPATDETVLGNFEDALFSHDGKAARFFRKAGGFFVETEGPGGVVADFEIKYTFGVEPLQQYLVELDRGRLQSFTICWDTERKQWFDLYPDEQVAHDDPFHWTGIYQNWNNMCADCHSTNLKKNYDLDSKAYQTQWDDIDVGCEACHGPGSAHVEWARAAGGEPGAARGEHGLVVDFAANDSRYQVDTCAPCHARRHRMASYRTPGAPLLDSVVPEVLRPDLYHSDGQIKEEVYVYGSFLQSKMYAQGVRCSDCHDPHGLGLKAQGNALCTQCHSSTPDPRFPSLQRKTYDTPDHHFHKVASDGSRCVDCHMIERDFMVVDPRRDHSFRIPRPDLSEKFGTPNACNDCHADRPAAWAAEEINKRFGPSRGEHFVDVIAAARNGAYDALPKLAGIAGDAAQPSIVRATALYLLPGYGARGLPALISATRDVDPLVRVSAVGNLETLPQEQKLRTIGPLLDDPIRAVRIEAARVMATVPEQAMNPEILTSFKAALLEYRNLQVAEADAPSGHFNMGAVQANLGRLDLAEQSYKNAIELDAGFLPAQFNLANLYNKLGHNLDAEAVLKTAIQHSPDEGELYYSLGLVLAEMSRMEDSANALRDAARLLPGRARVRYNYALALQHLGRASEAERELLAAHNVDTNDTSIIQALVILYVQQQDWDQALEYALKVVTLQPNEPGALQQLKQIQLQAQSTSSE